MITKNEAQKLWGQLRNALLGLEDLLNEIIEKKAWEPLGYRTFHEAWQAELKGVQLSELMQSKVVYAMFSAGATPLDVAQSLSIGTQKAQGFEKAFDREVPVENAALLAKTLEPQIPPLKPGETIVHTHVRKRPKFSGKIEVEGFSEKEIADWKLEAGKRNLNWKEMCAELLREGLNMKLGMD